MQDNNQLNFQNLNCQKCPIFELRNNVVNGIGPLDSKILFLVDFPSQEEDSTGIPLKGASSQKLSSILSRMGLHISQVRVSYGVRCRPNLKTIEGFRQPHYEEVESCMSYLDLEMQKVKPNVVVALGNGAVSAILGIKKPKIGDLRGSEIFSEKYKVKVMPTLAMGSILRSPNNEETVVQDIKRALDSSKYPEMTKAVEVNNFVIDTIEKFDSFYSRILEQTEVAWDLETSSFDWQTGHVTCISFSWKENTSVVLPLTKWIGVEKERIELKDKKIRRKGVTEVKQVEVVIKEVQDTYHPYWGEKQEYVMDKLRSIMESDIKWLGQNLKFDYKWFLQMGWNLKPAAYDTLLMHYLLHETAKSGHGLKDMALQYTNKGQYDKELEDWFSNNKMSNEDNRNYARVPEALLYKYAGMDAAVTFELKNIFYPLIQQEGMTDLFHKLVMPFNHTLTHMEFEGFKIDRQTLNKAKDYYQQQLTIKEKEIQDEIKKVTSEVVNLDSPKQLSTLLFDVLKLPIIKMTKSVSKPVPSTDEEVLNALAEKHPIPMKIVEYRGIAKLLRTYVIGIEEKLDPNDRLHIKFFQEGTETGRLSSRDPNGQNFPRKEKLVKNMFIVDKDNVLVQADQGQNEFRWWGILSNDPQLVRDLNDGVDIHRLVAALANKIEYDQVTTEQRQKAKSIVFGLMFSMGPDKLAKEHGVTIEYANHVKDTFFSRYPTAKQWKYEIVKFARKNLYVQSRFGRVRHLLAINHPDNKISYADEQGAVNAPIQGAASDYVSNAANRVFLRLQELGLHGKLRNLIHDAIYVEVPKTELRQTLQIMNEEMTRRILDIQVPLVAEFEVGKRWGRMHKIEVKS